MPSGRWATFALPKHASEMRLRESLPFIDSKASYQKLIYDLQKSEFITKGAEGAIASARAAIAKAQALIQDNEQKSANEKKKVEKLEAVKSRV